MVFRVGTYVLWVYRNKGVCHGVESMSQLCMVKGGLAGVGDSLT